MRFLFWTIHNTRELKEQEEIAKKMIEFLSPVAKNCLQAEQIGKRLEEINALRLKDSNTLHDAIQVIDKDLVDLEKAVQIIIKRKGVREKYHARQSTKV